MAKITNKRLHECIVQMMELEDRILEEEMKHAKPHVFSAEFERKMEEVMRVQTRVCKRSDAVRYLATAAVVVLMIFGLLFIGNENLRASDFRINVLEWMEDFFVVENDTNRDKSDENDVLFHESQIGYIPEGFEKVEEDVTFTKVFYRYEKDKEEYFSIEVWGENNLFEIDNIEIFRDTGVNEDGLEYHYLAKTDTGEIVFTWIDKKGKLYYLVGSIEEDELIKFMNGISY